jgi:hypothetical protein
VWDRLLEQRGCAASIRRQAELPAGTRAWAFDLPRAGSARSCPKRFVSASVDEFADVYLAMASAERHAYEILQPGAPCHLFFDLDGPSGDGSEAMARHVAEEAASVLRDLVAARAPALLWS